jgi:AcrR family transcriptional regulator
LVRRRAILEAALGTFAALGYEGASMRAIAEAAHISEALLYRYYASKLVLFHAVVTVVLERSATLNDSYAAAARGDTSLHQFLQEIGRLCSEHVDDLHAWYVARLLLLPLDDAERRAVIDEPEQAFQTVSAGMAARGAFDDPYVAARTFVGTLEYDGALARTRSGRPSPRLRAVFLEQLIELVAGGRSSSSSKPLAPARTTLEG